MGTFNDFYSIYRTAAVSSDEIERGSYARRSGTKRCAADEFDMTTRRPISECEYEITPVSSRMFSDRNNATTQTHICPVKGNRLIVVVPIYRAQLSPFEQMCLENSFRILEKYDICILCPSDFRQQYLEQNFDVSFMYYRFPKGNFRSKETYSYLLERPQFYDGLSQWEYMLIIQPDVWLFGPKSGHTIEEFMDMGHVYIGAPWKKEYTRSFGISADICGNGGLSLRKTRELAHMLRTSRNKRAKLAGVEDQFISYMLYMENKSCPVSTARTFSIDNDFGFWKERLGDGLPWGVHMPKAENIKFWLPYISEGAPVIYRRKSISLPSSASIVHQSKGNVPGLIVSLTSFGERLEKDCPLVLSNFIRNQTLQPDKIVLCIYSEDEKRVPDAIRKLEKEGTLEVIVYPENLRCHLKYYPAMLKYPDSAIITIDDDTFYHKDTVKDLFNSYCNYPDCVSALRCHRMRFFINGSVRPYAQWDYECETRQEDMPSDRLFATGVGGVLYPPGIFSGLLDESRMREMITTDDIYLKELEHLAGVYVRAAYRGKPRRLNYINSLSARRTRLCDENTKKDGGRNDENLSKCDFSYSTFGIIGQDLNIDSSTGEHFKEVEHKRKIVYTCISGNYDTLREPEVVSPGWEYICFTDQKITSGVWEIHPMPEDVMTDKSLSQVKRQRIVKIRPDKFLGEYDISMWVDANLIIRGNLDEFVHDCGGDSVDVGVTVHPQRKCIYKEKEAIRRMRKDTDAVMNPQIDFYKKEKFPENFGLNETNVIIRRRSAKVTEVMDLWEKMLREYSHRDQMSFNYCLWKLGYKITDIPVSLRDRYFKFCPHRPRR